MKKVVLFVASVLAAIQSIANRSTKGINSTSLVLFPLMEYIIMAPTLLMLLMPRTILIIQ